MGIYEQSTFYPNCNLKGATWPFRIPGKSQFQRYFQISGRKFIFFEMVQGIYIYKWQCGCVCCNINDGFIKKHTAGGYPKSESRTKTFVSFKGKINHYITIKS